MIPLADKIATNLRRFREARGLTQHALAERCEQQVSQQMIGRLENGERKITASYMEMFAQALGVSPVDLITGPQPGKASGRALDKQVAHELARTVGRLVLNGREPEPDRLQPAATMLQELFETFAEFPNACTDLNVARPLIAHSARRGSE